MEREKINDSFISHAADILGDTNRGLSGSQIVKHCNSYAVDFDVKIPISTGTGLLLQSREMKMKSTGTGLLLQSREMNT